MFLVQNNQNNQNKLVWLDLEMTGLEVDAHHIVEIATIITDLDLENAIEGPVIAIHQSEEVLAGMNEWCVKTHYESGLVERVRASNISLAEAEAMSLDFVRAHVDEGTSPLCGNSIWQDRRFLAKYMPTFESYLHYRLLDVSTLKILAQNWNPPIYQAIDKHSKHLALDDIRASIEELKYYRSHFLVLQ